MIGNFLNDFLSIIIDFVIYIVRLVLFPIEILINPLFPQLGGVVEKINSMFSIALTYVYFIIDSIGIDAFTLKLLCTAIILSISVKLSSWVMKLAVKWYNMLKP